MKNIDQFNEIVGEVFAALYQSFPKKVDLSATEISKDKSEGVDREFVAEAIRWLSDYGYVEVKSIHRMETFNYCSLTPKGLGILNAVPDSLKEKSASYGELITEAAKDVALEQGKKGLGELAAKAIAYGVTSLGNAVS